MLKKKKKCRKQNAGRMKDVRVTALYKMLSVWSIWWTLKERSRNHSMLDLLFLTLKRRTIWMWLSKVVMQRSYKWVYVFVLNQTISQVFSDMEELTYYEAQILWKKECVCIFHNKKESLVSWIHTCLGLCFDMTAIMLENFCSSLKRRIDPV